MIRSPVRPIRCNTHRCLCWYSANGGSGDAATSLAHGMGSVDMLDAGDDLTATPRASSSGGASPWGSAGKSSSSSLLSDATAFQVRCAALPHRH